MPHNVTTEAKKRITLKVIMYKKCIYLGICHHARFFLFFFFAYFFFTSKIKTGMDFHTCITVYFRSMGVDNNDIKCI